MELVQARPTLVGSATQEFLIRVYAWMTAGLALTGAVAYATVQSEAFFFQLIPWLNVLMFGSFAFCWVLQSNMHKLSPGLAGAGFAVYAGLLGLVLAPIFVIYAHDSIARVFFISAATFGGMSVYGMTTKQDLSSVGSLCIMGFWGIFVAGLVNMFIGSPAVSWVTSFIGVFVFTGLAAYKNQQLAQAARHIDASSQSGQTASIFGALILYITFINLFLSLLRLFGDRRR